MNSWSASDAGVLVLPSGRLIRGRGLRQPPTDGIVPDFGIYLLNKEPQPMPWNTRWVRWPDFRLPTDRVDAQDALDEAWRRAKAERVEVACGGGRGRTGTALACIAVLDGVPPPTKPWIMSASTMIQGQSKHSGSADMSLASSHPRRPYRRAAPHRQVDRRDQQWRPHRGGCPPGNV